MTADGVSELCNLRVQRSSAIRRSQSAATEENHSIKRAGSRGTLELPFESPLRDSLPLVNDQPISVGIAKRSPMTNFRFSRPEEEGNAVIAQVVESGFKVVDFKCN